MYRRDGRHHHCQIGRNIQDCMRKCDILETGSRPRVERVARPASNDGQHQSVGEDSDAQTDDEGAVALGGVYSIQDD